MNYSPAFKWFVIVLIPLTFGWKLVDERQTAHESKINIAEFLSRHKFDITKRIVADIPVIDAIAGTCRMSVVEASPDGWMRDFINNILGATEHQFTVFRGNIYPEQPTWLDFHGSLVVEKSSQARLGTTRGPCHRGFGYRVVRCGAFAVERAFILRRRAPWLTDPDGRHVTETVPNRDLVPRFG